MKDRIFTLYKHCDLTGTYCGTITEPGLPVVLQDKEVKHMRALLSARAGLP